MSGRCMQRGGARGRGATARGAWPVIGAACRRAVVGGRAIAVLRMAGVVFVVDTMRACMAEILMPSGTPAAPPLPCTGVPASTTSPPSLAAIVHLDVIHRHGKFMSCMKHRKYAEELI
jgi:hypothetical protein